MCNHGEKVGSAGLIVSFVTLHKLNLLSSPASKSDR
jgi:hypothetical protein